MIDAVKRFPVVKEMQEGKEVIWINPDLEKFEAIQSKLELTLADIEDAEQRLERFAPLIQKCFPETAAAGGIIESPLTPIPKMQKKMKAAYGNDLPGHLLLKQDSHLAIAGSIKARGGIYEVLKHTEDLALKHGLITLNDDYAQLADKKDFFKKYIIQVGSTGNLGLSIGMMSAAIGYEVIVHMSADARQWKKDLLRSHGVQVMEYDSDYSGAVKNGRKLSDANPNSYFVDDENSKNLFLGYAVAAKRLKKQLEDLKIVIDEKHPLFVYLPCGVGGAPGGITFGLKQIFKDMVHCFFIEPVQAPCMLLGMATDLHQDICVQDIGLNGMTHADGLAVGRPSGFVGKVMKPLLSGALTVKDSRLYDYMRNLWDSEDIFVEPSACAAFQGPAVFGSSDVIGAYVKKHELEAALPEAVHIAWATGGQLVPEAIREEYKQTYLD